MSRASRRAIALGLLTMGLMVGVNLLLRSYGNEYLEAIFMHIRPQEAKREEQLEDQMARALNALQQNTQDVTQMLARGQREMTGIETKLRELRQERAILELTPEQQEVIKSVVRRPQSLREMLASLDFWVGQVAVNACFFVLGLVTSWLGRRRTPSGP
jgi:hypothetical protein